MAAGDQAMGMSLCAGYTTEGEERAEVEGVFLVTPVCLARSALRTEGPENFKGLLAGAVGWKVSTGQGRGPWQ